MMLFAFSCFLFRVLHSVLHVGCRTDKADWSAGVSSRGVVRAEGVDWGLEAGNLNSKSLSSAVRTAITFKDTSAKDFRTRDMITLATNRKKRPHKRSIANDWSFGGCEQTCRLNYSRTDSSGRRQNPRLKPCRFFRQKSCGGASQLVPGGRRAPL